MDQLVDSASTITITIHGHEFIVDREHESFWRMCERGEWEPYTFDIFDRFLRPEVTYVDLGAWIGPTVIYAAKLAGQAYATEPDPIAYISLFINTLLNSGNANAPLTSAVADHDGMVLLGGDELGNSMTRISSTTNQFHKHCRTLATTIEKMEAHDPMFIKIDIEGSEELVLRDISFFEQHKPTLYLSTHFDEEWYEDPAFVDQQLTKLSRMYKHFRNVTDRVLLFTDEDK